MIRYLRRRGHDVAFCTVGDRIVRELGTGRREEASYAPRPRTYGMHADGKLNGDFTAAATNLAGMPMTTL